MKYYNYLVKYCLLHILRVRLFQSNWASQPMTVYDPFSRYIPLNESNALKVNIARLRGPTRQPEFNTAIDILLEIRRVLQQLEKLGRLQELGQAQFYVEALRWLHFEAPIGNFVGVPQITSYEMVDSDPNIASLFRQFASNYQQNLRSNPIYSAIEATSFAITQALVNRADEQAATIVEQAEQEVEIKTSEALAKLQTDIRGEQQAVLESYETRRDEVVASLESAVDNATQRFQSARSLDKWELSYNDAIEEYKMRLFGPQWADRTFARNLAAFMKLRKDLSSRISTSRFPIASLFIVLVKLVFHIIRNAFSLLRYFRKKSASYSGKRTTWFIILASFAAFFVLFSVITLLNLGTLLGYDLSSIQQAHDTQPYLKYAVFIPIAVILGLAYSFAIKNFRIYSNMLDQYQHRRTVAATAQGIILSMKDDTDTTLRSQVTAAASAALFEHKNTGHLTKKEAESLSIVDLLSTVRSRS